MLAPGGWRLMEQHHGKPVPGQSQEFRVFDTIGEYDQTVSVVLTQAAQ